MYTYIYVVVNVPIPAPSTPSPTAAGESDTDVILPRRLVLVNALTAFIPVHSTCRSCFTLGLNSREIQSYPPPPGSANPTPARFSIPII